MLCLEHKVNTEHEKFKVNVFILTLEIGFPLREPLKLKINKIDSIYHSIFASYKVFFPFRWNLTQKKIINIDSCQLNKYTCVSRNKRNHQHKLFTSRNTYPHTIRHNRSNVCLLFRLMFPASTQCFVLWIRIKHSIRYIPNGNIPLDSIWYDLNGISYYTGKKSTMRYFVVTLDVMPIWSAFKGKQKKKTKILSAYGNDYTWHFVHMCDRNLNKIASTKQQSIQ